ncbi:SIS domain-containing protein, partial [Streptomyces sp. TRM76130]|nr:SIS domain-containing protein [Streptomyces sp. TRM76130]
TLDAVPTPFAPASTVVTAALLQAVLATTAAALADRGIEPPLLRSGNVDGGHDWNDRVLRQHRDRIFYHH